MPEQIVTPVTPSNAPEFPIYDLYRQLLEAWNEQDATAFAAKFADDGDAVGFDGSIMDGRAEIESSLSGIFSDHETADYVALVRKIRFPAPDTAVLRAVVGMVPPESSELAPERNAVQSLVAQRFGGQWRIVLFQNTPARFDGRPELAEGLTREIQDGV
jgi:uncharacterized protein (TIGR02246 family)